ncbi:MAG TPA: GntR family transcriptional regulator [Vicinamibacterales bacterium]|nr:GntR family transcriptional regulator [Vicinamibacterales bacterium]
MMTWSISRASSVPPHRQLVEQVKVALLTGTLRAGDMLPSIRDLARKVGVTEAVVRRAYSDLSYQGIVTAWHGKGVQVNERLTYDESQALVERYNVLVSDVLSRVQKEGLLLSPFARLLSARADELERTAPSLVYVDATDAVARERAAAISRAWSVHVEGLALADLPEVLAGPRRPAKILTNYYRHSQVLERVQERGIPVIPIGLSYSRRMASRIEHLPRGARLLLIFDPEDRARAELMLKDYRLRFNRLDVQFEGRIFPGATGLRRLGRRHTYALLLISVRVWDRLPPDVQRMEKVMRTEMEFTPAQLEQARIAAEVVL